MSKLDHLVQKFVKKCWSGLATSVSKSHHKRMYRSYTAVQWIRKLSKNNPTFALNESSEP